MARVFELLFCGIVLGALPAGCGKSESRAGNAYNGYFSGNTKGQMQVYGWVWDAKHAENALTVEIFDGTTSVGTVRADLFFKDVLEQKIGTGKYGFAFTVPAELRDGKRHEIHAKVQGTDFELKNSPMMLEFGT